MNLGSHHEKNGQNPSLALWVRLLDWRGLEACLPARSGKFRRGTPSIKPLCPHAISQPNALPSNDREEHDPDPKSCGFVLRKRAGLPSPKCLRAPTSNFRVSGVQVGCCAKLVTFGSGYIHIYSSHPDRAEESSPQLGFEAAWLAWPSSLQTCASRNMLKTLCTHACVQMCRSVQIRLHMRMMLSAAGVSVPVLRGTCISQRA